MDKNNIRINVIVNEDIRRSLKTQAFIEGKTITQVVTTLIESWLRKKGVYENSK